ncbi:MAG: sigma 54-interacting transcriptional regulator [Polyangiaceae bacterium]
MSKLLLAEEDVDRTAELLFRRLLAVAEADRGFIVAGPGGAFDREFAIHLDSRSVDVRARQFSRSLVRRAVESGQPIFSASVLEDPRFSRIESIEHAGAHSVLVVPLVSQGVVFGVLYFDRTRAGEPFVPASVDLITDLAELAALFIKRALEREALRQRNADLERDLFAKFDFPGIVGRDRSLLQVLQRVARYAATDTTVLIEGETGTGKELVARALHINSKRRAKPFGVVHCAALPHHLLESELFGHARGAFTGAEKDRVGRIAEAHGGTLFLDEIGEISLEVQSKLLRFLQFGEIQRPGCDRTEKIDVRVVAATHRDLRQLVAEGKFREDLYYRIRVLEVKLPPLRERRSDLPVLIDAILKRHESKDGVRRVLTARALEALECHSFPGNVRELEHALERAAVLAPDARIDVDLLPPEIARYARPPRPADELERTTPVPASTDRVAACGTTLEDVRKNALSTAEHEFLAGLIQQAGGNISLASRRSGIHRSYLQRLMSKHGLR